MLRPLLVLALLLTGCRQPPPEVRPAPPRHPAFGEAERVGVAVTDAAPSAARGTVMWISAGTAFGTRISTNHVAMMDVTFVRIAGIALSSDGESLAFTSRLPKFACATCLSQGARSPAPSHPDLRVRRLSDDNNRLLDSGPWDCRNPSWSPDGTQIVFEISDRGTSRLWIVVVALPERTYVAEGSDPAWAPDGARIAYVLGSDLWTVRPDGTDPKQLTSGFVALSPSWSPDSHWIAFARPDAAGRPDDLWAASANGGRCVRLTWDPAGEWDPCWAPDGRLYFVSDRGGETALWVASPENKELLR
ncbi:MAG: PD40 domain-containing protein [Planctomycetes bacterium]|nr:PD40 domain-containing protein [Planctomycetota bacterium]